MVFPIAWRRGPVIHSTRSTRMSAPEKVTVVTECSDQARATEFKRVAKRNNSLSSTGRLLVFAFIFLVSVGIAAAFAAFGAWLNRPHPER